MWRWEAEAAVRRTSRTLTLTWRCHRQWNMSPRTLPVSRPRPGYDPSSGTYHLSYKLFFPSGDPSRYLSDHVTKAMA